MEYVFSALIYTFFVSSCVVFFTGALVLFVLTLPFDPNGRILHFYSCVWAQTYLLNPLWRLSFEGREHVPSRSAAVLVANHVSILDILVLYRLFRPFKWVAKASLLRVPFIGWNMVLNRHVAVRRGDPRSIGKMMEACERWLDRGVPVMLFPEGTRSRNGSLLPFKDGAFRLATKKGVPVIPIVVAGTEAILPKNGLRVALKASCHVKILPPVAPQAFGGDVAALRDHVHDLIAQEKARLGGILP